MSSILRRDIANPLRNNLYCPATNVMKLRKAMAHLDDKILTEEMDAQEFLQYLFTDALKLTGFFSLSTGVSEHFHQILLPNSSIIVGDQIPTIQQLLEKSFSYQRIKFVRAPAPVFLVQAPRFGNHEKLFETILPSRFLDVTHLLEGCYLIYIL